jgi:magnesium-transporting ATPase (P-type)
VLVTPQAFLVEGGKEIGFVGNRTDCALLMLLRSWNLSYKQLRDANESKIAKVPHCTQHIHADGHVRWVCMACMPQLQVTSSTSLHLSQMLPCWMQLLHAYCVLLVMLAIWQVVPHCVAVLLSCRSSNAHPGVQFYGFSSEKKMASVLVKQDNKLRLYNKGAAEWILRRCVSLRSESGQVVEMTETTREQLMSVVTGMASRGLRCICLTYTDFPAVDPSRPADFFDSPPDDNLIALAIVGIKVCLQRRR